MKPSPLPAPDARQKFMDALERAKMRIARTPGPDGRLREGSNRSLAQDVGVSPSRIGEFLKSDYRLPVLDGGKLCPEPKAKKVLVGFTMSVERTLEWLKKEGLATDALANPQDVAPRADEVVKAYWPEKLSAAIAEQFFQDALHEGARAIRPEIELWSKVKVRVKVLAWGPFAHVDREEPRGFLRLYGEALLRGVDPVDCESHFKDAPSLADALDLPATSRREGSIVVLGLYDTLHRRFGGFRFVTFPVRVPLVGLLVTREGSEASSYDFERVFGTKSDRPLFAVRREVGHLFLGSIYPDLKINLFQETDRAGDIAEKLRRTARTDGEVAFLSDGILALEVFSHLARQKGISVRPVSQADGRESELSYQIGFMLRNEDRDISDLLEASQKALFRASWRALDIFKHFLVGISKWLRDLEADEYEWDKKIFILDEADLRDVTFTKRDASKFLEMAKKASVSSNQDRLWSFIHVET